MYNQPYFIPRYQIPNIPFNMLRANSPTKGINIFNKLGTTFNNIKKINWQELINNTSKTLGIINQTIPLVKQVGPMFNNMRSMIKIASIFKDETDPQPKAKNQYQNINENNNDTKEKINNNQEYTNTPTFFLNT